MRLKSIEVRRERFPLTRPYTIAFRTTDSVDNFIVRLRTDGGLEGLGAAAPEPHVTGETEEDAARALSPESLGWLEGRSLGDPKALGEELIRRLPRTPAARAALDMALHDIAARRHQLPLADWLGRRHHRLPTSITIGIKSVAETLAEADEYRGRGFFILKLKVGSGLEEDVERTRRLREHVGSGVRIRVDANQAHDRETFLAYWRATRDCDLEFVEQPLPAGELETLRALPPEARHAVAIDESVLDDRDALAACLPAPAGRVLNVKLMKCGGVTTALRIAAVAQAHGRELMWGCMDESRISIAAALHTAFACPATRYLDLDGSLDLARDVASGGFVLEDGVMQTTGAPGLGLQTAEG